MPWGHDLQNRAVTEPEPVGSPIELVGAVAYERTLFTIERRRVRFVALGLATVTKSRTCALHNLEIALLLK
jgi:hypothetical protein